jgi:hypothetical protein
MPKPTVRDLSIPDLTKAPDKLYTLSQVRAQLYELHNRTLGLENKHFAAFGDAHPANCQVCVKYNAEFWALNKAISHFGGKCRR